MKLSNRYTLDGSTILLSFISGVVVIGFLDPINWPKQIALITILPFIALSGYRVYAQSKKLSIQHQQVLLLIISCTLIIISTFLSKIFENLSWSRILWGLWGRNNGLLTLISLFVIAISFSLLNSSSSFTFKFLHSLELSSIAFCTYGLIQWLGADPVNWSQSNQVFFLLWKYKLCFCNVCTFSILFFNFGSI